MKTESYKMFMSEARKASLENDLVVGFNKTKSDHYNIPVTITIEVPEPTITITPSQLEKLLYQIGAGEHTPDDVIEMLFNQGESDE